MIILTEKEAMAIKRIFLVLIEVPNRERSICIISDIIQFDNELKNKNKIVEFLGITRAEYLKGSDDD